MLTPLLTMALLTTAPLTMAPLTMAPLTMAILTMALLTMAPRTTAWQDLVLQLCPEHWLGGLLPWHSRVTTAIEP